MNVRRVCIYGLGAIGGFVAARLAATDEAASGALTVSAVARGRTLAALRERGLVLRSGGRETVARIAAAERPADLGPQDVVIVTVKTTALEDVAANIAPLLGPDTVIVSAMNGVPWWFFAREGMPRQGAQLASVDPHGRLARAMPASRIVGCVVHMACATPAPGTIQHNMGQRLILGEADGRDTPRLAAIAGLLGRAGFEVEVADNVQDAIWYKLWGNMTMNPIAVLTGATVDRILDDPLIRGFATEAMREAARVGAKIGLPIAGDPEDRHLVTRKLGAFKPSTLQDAEAGRPLELDALIGSVVEIARLVGEPTPAIDALFGLVRLKARVSGLYPG